MPSRDGRRIVLASNWTSKVSGTVPSLGEIKAYLLDARKLPPDLVQDLVSDSSDVYAIYLRWTAPADRGVAVASYELRRSLSPITEANFGSATQVSTGTPNYPGATERITATGLAPNTCYYFALKSHSSCDTVSAL